MNIRSRLPESGKPEPKRIGQVSCGAVLFEDKVTGKYAPLCGKPRQEALMKLARGEEQPYRAFTYNPHEVITRHDVYWLSCGQEYVDAYNETKENEHGT